MTKLNSRKNTKVFVPSTWLCWPVLSILEKQLIWDLLDAEKTQRAMKLTESYAMWPGASGFRGFIFPQSTKSLFAVAQILQEPIRRLC